MEIRKLFCALLVSVFSMSACGSIQIAPRPSQCVDRPSIIYETFGDYYLFNTLILIGMSRGIEAVKNKNKRLQVINTGLEVYKTMQQTIVKENIKYTDIVKFLQWLDFDFADEVLILSTLIVRFQVDVPLSPCDRFLLKSHLRDGIALLNRKKNAIKK